MSKDVKKTEDDETIGHGNFQDEKRKAIYANADKDRDESEDFVDVDDADHDKTVEIKEEEEQEELRAEEAPAKRKFKVNGQEIELTEEEVAEWVQKGKSADEKFQEAARMKREAEELSKKPPVKTDASEDVVSDDDVALARALQMGSEDDAAKVIKRLRTPSVKTEEVVALVDARLSIAQQQQKFLSDYKDVMEDQQWKDIVLDRDEYLALKGKPSGYDRFKEAGEYARGLKAKAAPQADVQQKLERKASLKVVPAANVRQAAPQDEDKEESTSDVIAGMAKARQGRSVGGGNI